MSNSVLWFVNKIRGKLNYQRTDGQVIYFDHKGVAKTVYCPFTAEYEITKQLVSKISKLGVDILIYPTAWCRATRESIAYGDQCGVEVISLKDFMEKYAS